MSNLKQKTSNEMEDTYRPGFVSTIVMKFTQTSGSSKFDEDKFSTNCKKMPSLSKKQNLNDAPINSNNFEAKFEVVGEVSVKDKIKAFSSMSDAVSSGSRRVGVMPAKSQGGVTVARAMAKSSVASRFLQMVEKKEAEKEVRIIKPLGDITKKFSIDNSALPISSKEPAAVKFNVGASTKKPSVVLESSKVINEIQEITEHRESDKRADDGNAGTDNEQEFEFQQEYTLTDFMPQSEEVEFKSFGDFKEVCLDEIGERSVSSVSSLMNEFDSSVEERLTYPTCSYPEEDPSYFPLPKTYVTSFSEGQFHIKLPKATTKSCLRNKDRSNSIKKKIKIVDQPTKLMETYNTNEYERGDDSIDPLTASAEYEIEKKTENLDKFIVQLEKDDRGLGLSIVGIGLGSDSGSEKLGIYIKALTAGGAAERTNKLMIHDQLLEVDGTSLVGVTQSFAAQTLKGTTKNVKFLIGREKPAL